MYYSDRNSDEHKVWTDINRTLSKDMSETTKYTEIRNQSKQMLSDFKDSVNKLSDKQKENIAKQAADTIESNADEDSFYEEDGKRWMYFDDANLGESLYDSLPNNVKNKFDFNKFNANVSESYSIAKTILKMCYLVCMIHQCRNYICKLH